MDKNTQHNQIPQQIVDAIESSWVFEALEKIGETYGLHIDQIGQLDVDTRRTLLGKEKSSDYIKNITENLEISSELAEKIATDVNTQIFLPLREHLQKTQEAVESVVEQPQSTPSTPPPPANPVEKVGNINIIRRPASSSPQYNDSKLDKDAVLHDLENIEKLKPQNAPNFVEHLLGNPVQSPAQTEVKKPTPPPQPQKKYDTDPYREQI